MENDCYMCANFHSCNVHWSMYKNKGCADLTIDERLEGREARCGWCGKREPSRPSLPFFWYREDKELDEYYCGCGGWD